MDFVKLKNYDKKILLTYILLIRGLFFSFPPKTLNITLELTFYCRNNAFPCNSPPFLKLKSCVCLIKLVLGMKEVSKKVFL